MKDTSASYNYDVSTYFLDKNWNGALPGDCTGADDDDDDYFDFLFDKSARDGKLINNTEEDGSRSAHIYLPPS